MCNLNFANQKATIVNGNGEPLITGKNVKLQDGFSFTTDDIQAADKNNSPHYMVVDPGGKKCRTGKYTSLQLTEYELVETDRPKLIP